MASRRTICAISALMLEEDMDEDDADDSVEDPVIIFLTAISVLLEGVEKARIRGYIDDVVPHYDEASFRRMFRISPGTFHILSAHLKDCPEMQPSGPGGREPISPHTQILLTLWYVGGQDTITRIADRFGLSESSVILCRDRVLSAIVHLRHKFIVWCTADEMQNDVAEFVKRNGFPGIVGAMDGTHIRIKAPHEHHQSYVNRKSFHSLQLQCVCRHNMMFTHAFTGYPGSCHDSRVLKNSDLWDDGLAKCNMQYHILGDGAYPLRKWLLTPFRDNGHLTPQQKKYNFYQSSNRVVIERAFALLKSRFRRLRNIDTSKVETAVYVIMGCCVLHNICIMQNDIIEDALSQGPDDNVVLPVAHVIKDQNAEGILKRDMIIRNLV